MVDGYPLTGFVDGGGGRPQLYQSVPFGRYQEVREQRRREAISKVEKQKMEEQRLLAVVNKWENVDRSKAAVAQFLMTPSSTVTLHRWSKPCPKTNWLLSSGSLPKFWTLIAGQYS